MTVNKVTEIKREELVPVISARAKAVELAQAAEQAMKEARVAELEFRVQVQQLYLEKGLNPTCKVDLATGIVSWAEDVTPAVEEVVPAPLEAAPVAEEETASPVRKRKVGKNTKE